MTLEQLDQELAALRLEMEEAKKLQAQKQDLEQQLRECRDRRESAAQVLAAEQEDVDRLEGMSLAYVFHTILGNRVEHLDKERREALAAHLSHQQALRDEADVAARLEETRARWVQAADAGKRYQAKLAEKRDLLKSLHGPEAERIEALEEAIANAEIQLREIAEAQSAGRSVLSCLNHAADSLDSAEGWGVWDMMGGGLIATAAKHDHIDDARGWVADAQAQLSRFRTELADVQMDGAPSISIGEFASFADYFFDGLIADWCVQDGIHDSQASVAQTQAQVREVLARLDRRAAAWEEDLRCRKAELESVTLGH